MRFFAKNGFPRTLRHVTRLVFDGSVEGRLVHGWAQRAFRILHGQYEVIVRGTGEAVWFNVGLVVVQVRRLHEHIARSGDLRNKTVSCTVVLELWR